jgi:hypothetical protein
VINVVPKGVAKQKLQDDEQPKESLGVEYVQQYRQKDPNLSLSEVNINISSEELY